MSILEIFGWAEDVMVRVAKGIIQGIFYTGAAIASLFAKKEHSFKAYFENYRDYAYPYFICVSVWGGLIWLVRYLY